jgi:hypothetical protein
MDVYGSPIRFFARFPGGYHKLAKTVMAVFQKSRPFMKKNRTSGLSASIRHNSLKLRFFTAQTGISRPVQPI